MQARPGAEGPPLWARPWAGDAGPGGEQAPSLFLWVTLDVLLLSLSFLSCTLGRGERSKGKTGDRGVGEQTESREEQTQAQRRDRLYVGFSCNHFLSFRVK